MPATDMASRRSHLDWELVWDAFMASRFLALGSFLLLVGGLLWIAGGREAFSLWGAGFLGFTSLGGLAFLLGWLGLRELAFDDKRLAFPFVLSVAALAVGVTPLLSAYPPIPQAFAAIFWIPYIPSAFAPVIALHAAFFLLLGRETPRGRNAPFVLLGSLYLIALAFASLSVQIATGPLGSLRESWYAALPGFAFLGYGVLAWSYLADWEDRVRAQLRPQARRGRGR